MENDNVVNYFDSFFYIFHESGVKIFLTLFINNYSKDTCFDCCVFVWWGPNVPRGLDCMDYIYKYMYVCMYVCMYAIYLC